MYIYLTTACSRIVHVFVIEVQDIHDHFLQFHSFACRVLSYCLLVAVDGFLPVLLLPCLASCIKAFLFCHLDYFVVQSYNKTKSSAKQPRRCNVFLQIFNLFRHKNILFVPKSYQKLNILCLPMHSNEKGAKRFARTLSPPEMSFF